jgi:hypothetical protein
LMMMMARPEIPIWLSASGQQIPSFQTSPVKA